MDKDGDRKNGIEHDVSGVQRDDTHCCISFRITICF